MARTSKKAPVSSAAPYKGRRGRRPAVWTLLTPEKLRDYRDRNKLSRKRLAAILGVSSTSVQNWETGKVASTKIQMRLAELIAAGPAAVVQASRALSLRETSSRSSDAIVTTATIVGAYMRVQTNLSPDGLVNLIRSVRRVLS